MVTQGVTGSDCVSDVRYSGLFSGEEEGRMVGDCELMCGLWGDGGFSQGLGYCKDGYVSITEYVIYNEVIISS